MVDVTIWSLVKYLIFLLHQCAFSVHSISCTLKMLHVKQTFSIATTNLMCLGQQQLSMVDLEALQWQGCSY